MLMTTGYLAPNIRTYRLYEEEIKKYSELAYGGEAADRLGAEMDTALQQSHFNFTNPDPNSEVDNNNSSGNFFNLNFHERHEDSLHFWCGLFTRGHLPYRLARNGNYYARCVGIRFNKHHYKELLETQKVSVFNRHYTQYSIATTRGDYDPNTNTWYDTLDARDRHGRMLKLRVEELLDTVAIDYAIPEIGYWNNYSLKNLYFFDDETVRHLIYDKIISSTFACGLINGQEQSMFNNFVLDFMNRLTIPEGKTVAQVLEMYPDLNRARVSQETLNFNYMEFRKGLAEIFNQCKSTNMPKNYGSWTSPDNMNWQGTRLAPVAPSYNFTPTTSRL
jgi:hypothetical protein